MLTCIGCYLHKHLLKMQLLDEPPWTWMVANPILVFILRCLFLSISESFLVIVGFVILTFSVNTRWASQTNLHSQTTEQKLYGQNYASFYSEFIFELESASESRIAQCQSLRKY